jgi:hypothetical protein
MIAPTKARKIQVAAVNKPYAEQSQEQQRAIVNDGDGYFCVNPERAVERLSLLVQCVMNDVRNDILKDGYVDHRHLDISLRVMRQFCKKVTLSLSKFREVVEMAK